MKVVQSPKAEMDNYLCEAQMICYNNSLKWWQYIECYRYPHLVILIKEFLSISVISDSSKRLFLRE